MAATYVATNTLPIKLNLNSLMGFFFTQILLYVKIFMVDIYE